MIRQVTVRNFKCFREQKFDLAGSVVLAGPNNAGKSTLLQAIVAWRSGLDRWRASAGAAARPNVREWPSRAPISRRCRCGRATCFGRAGKSPGRKAWPTRAG